MGKTTRSWRSRNLGWLIVGIVALFSVVLNTDFQAPPRYDGAGYCILAESIRTGQGYREIDHPEAPTHRHFPPGYPLVLAGLWALTGRSVMAAHGLSVGCTVMAVLLAWYWFRRVGPRKVSWPLGLALAVNWTWGRVGGTIQAEPLFLLLGQGAVLVSATGPRGSSIRRGCLVGGLLGAAMLTRHVGICLIAAVLLDSLLRRRWVEAGVTAMVASVVVLPWFVWLATDVERSQVSLFDSGGMAARILEQGLFYLRRWPDQFVGPFIEIATVFRRSRAIAILSTLVAAVVSTILLAGWIRACCSSRRRIAGLVPLSTLALLLVWPFTEAGRFLIPLLPFGLIGGVEGLAWLTKPFRRRSFKPIAAILLLCASLPYSIYSLATGRANAQRLTQTDFDAACDWIAHKATKPGPILSRHPGETFWLSGRKSLSPVGDEIEEVAPLIARYQVAYLLVDDDRYANAPPSLLGRFALAYPDRVRVVRDGPIRVYEVIKP